ncbi:MAG: hypothetical protein ACLUAF_08975 [Paraclostridium sordellii]
MIKTLKSAVDIDYYIKFLSLESKISEDSLKKKFTEITISQDIMKNLKIKNM